MVRIASVVVVISLGALIVSGCPNDPPGDGAGEGEGEAGEGEGEEGEGEGEGEGGEGEGEGEGEAGEGEGEGDVTEWYRDVLPIARANCAVCHVEGGIGHFPIDDIAEVVEHQDLIPEYVELGLMPPWMPSNDCGGHRFKGDRSLTAEERAVFLDWRDDGFILGDPADATGEVPVVQGLASVDLALEPAEDYLPNAANGDDYHCFLLDPGLDAQTFVTGYDIAPGERAIVHHVLLFAVDRAAAQDKEANTPGFGWTCFGGPDVDNGNGFPNTLGAWAPGSDATVFPDGTGIALAADQVIVMQVHYNTAALEDVPVPADRSIVQLQLADDVADPALLVPVPNDDFNLPPGVETTDTLVVPGAGRKVWGVLPHMHQLGERISLTAANAGCLIAVDEWDFQWQQSYFFEDVDFVQLGLLEQVTLSCTWFNATGGNVQWGENTTDEMCLAYVYTTQ
jgi:hypothetical protein